MLSRFSSICVYKRSCASEWYSPTWTKMRCDTFSNWIACIVEVRASRVPHIGWTDSFCIWCVSVYKFWWRVTEAAFELVLKWLCCECVRYNVSNDEKWKRTTTLKNWDALKQLNNAAATAVAAADVVNKA